MSDKYVQYMKNVGGRISIGAFNDDWEPIGGILLDNLINNGDVIIEDLQVVLVEKGND
jgi:hypothetical protein